MEHNMSIKIYKFFLRKMAFCTKPRVLVLLNKMGLPKEKIDIFLKLSDRSCLRVICLRFFGIMQYLLLCTLIIELQHESIISKHHSKYYPVMLGFLLFSTYLQKYLVVLHMFIFKNLPDQSLNPVLRSVYS
jgi:hypothetical protein